MAQGLGSARRTRQVVANAQGDTTQGEPFGPDLHAAVEPDSTKPRLKSTAELKASATSGSPPKRQLLRRQLLRRQLLRRQLLPAFEEDPTHQQTRKSSGELAHIERFFGRLRQKRAQQVRRTRAASESERTGHLTTKLFVEWYNEAVT
jgi:hypothetical protein